METYKQSTITIDFVLTCVAWQLLKQVTFALNDIVLPFLDDSINIVVSGVGEMIVPKGVLSEKKRAVLSYNVVINDVTALGFDTTDEAYAAISEYLESANSDGTWTEALHTWALKESCSYLYDIESVKVLTDQPRTGPITIFNEVTTIPVETIPVDGILEGHEGLVMNINQLLSGVTVDTYLFATQLIDFVLTCVVWQLLKQTTKVSNDVVLPFLDSALSILVVGVTEIVSDVTPAKKSKKTADANPLLVQYQVGINDVKALGFASADEAYAVFSAAFDTAMTDGLWDETLKERAASESCNALNDVSTLQVDTAVASPAILNALPSNIGDSHSGLVIQLTNLLTGVSVDTYLLTTELIDFVLTCVAWQLLKQVTFTTNDIVLPFLNSAVSIVVDGAVDAITTRGEKAVLADNEIEMAYSITIHDYKALGFESLDAAYSTLSEYLVKSGNDGNWDKLIKERAAKESCDALADTETSSVTAEQGVYATPNTAEEGDSGLNAETDGLRLGGIIAVAVVGAAAVVAIGGRMFYKTTSKVPKDFTDGASEFKDPAPKSSADAGRDAVDDNSDAVSIEITTEEVEIQNSGEEQFARI